MKKIVGGVLAALGLLTAGLGGTYAYFTATAESAGGTPVAVGADAVELRLTTDGAQASGGLTFADLLPNDSEQYFIVLANDGSTAATAQWAFRDVENLENGCLPTEQDAGDTTCGDGPTDGELGDRLAVELVGLSGADCSAGLDGTGGSAGYPAGSGDGDFTSLGFDLEPGESRCVRVDVEFTAGTGDPQDNNQAQSDVTSFRFDFRLEQS